MPITKTNRHYPTSPVDRAAWQQLQDAYAAYKAIGEGTRRQPWTPTSCVLLGRLFFVAWGKMPSHSRLGPAYALPTWNTIQRRWGTLQAYHGALTDDPPPCGCTSQGARCAETQIIHQRWQRGEPERTDLLVYQTHLRVAGVWPGKAKWEGELHE